MQSLIKPKFHYTSPVQVRNKVTDLSRTQIMKIRDTNHVADFHDLCPQQVRTLTRTCPGLCRRLSPCIVTSKIPLKRHKRVWCRFVTYLVANISTCRDGLCPRLSWFVSATFTETLWFHDMSPFVSVTFIICVRDSLRGSFSESWHNRIWVLLHRPNNCSHNLTVNTPPMPLKSLYTHYRYIGHLIILLLSLWKLSMKHIHFGIIRQPPKHDLLSGKAACKIRSSNVERDNNL